MLRSQMQSFKHLRIYPKKGFLHLHLQPSTLSPKCKHTSLASQQHHQHSFTVSYLINNCAFSPETALRASKYVQFKTPQKPDSVIAFFRANGFTNSQINTILKTAPNVLRCDPHKRVSPKFQFLRSKGASTSDIVKLVSNSPRILYSSLENSVIPTFESVRRFFPSDKDTVDHILCHSHFFGHDLAVRNMKLLRDNGVSDSNIYHLLRTRSYVLLSYYMEKDIEEVKEMGFETSKYKFVVALQAKIAVSKPRWDAKVEAFKRWGWSEEMVLDTFRRQPLFMLKSEDKINRVMEFCVDRLGWDSLALAKKPEMFGFSLEKRIIPRAFVVQCLIAKGLRKKDANLFAPFQVSDKLFLDKYVNCFQRDRDQLLKVYKEKMNVQ